MALSLTLTPLTMPDGTEFPGTPQQLSVLLAQYYQITGGDSFNGINYGATTPAAADRDKPWYKTDVSNNPLGWFNWNGSAWVQILFQFPMGTTANRPASPSSGQLYFDTTINVALVYERSQWRTLDGSPGDVKFVSAATISAALTANPGWTQYTTASGKVIAAADGTTGKSNGDTTGATEVTLLSTNLPSFTIPLGLQNDTNGGDHNDSGSDSFVRTGSGLEADFTGDADPISVMQPTIYLWCLIKS